MSEAFDHMIETNPVRESIVTQPVELKSDIKREKIVASKPRK
jgi:hypothetical protein